MKNLLKIVFVFLFAARAFAESNDSMESLTNAEAAVQFKLEQFGKTNTDYQLLLDAQKISASMNRRGDKTTLNELDERCLRLQLKVLLTIAKARDPYYDPKASTNAFYMNVMPPITKGNQPFMSGMDPNAIKDPEARKAYEDAIAENVRRGKKYEQERSLSYGVDHVVIDLWYFVKNFPEDSAGRKSSFKIIEATIFDKIILNRLESDSYPEYSDTNW